MNVEWSPSVTGRSRLYAALGEPARSVVVDRLLLGDAAPGELGRDLGVPSNLLAHHVKLLEQAGVVERSRSEGDHRRTYLRPRSDALARLAPRKVVHAPRVVFVCTRHSWPRRAVGPAQRHSCRVREYRAGAAGAPAVGRRRPEPRAVPRPARTTHVDQVLRPDDLVVAVCDTAHEQLDVDRQHWSVRDLAQAGTGEAFDQALTDRIDRLAPAVHPSGGNDD